MGLKVDSLLCDYIRMVTTSYRLLLFILAFSPLAFGTSEHWSLMTVELIAGLSLCFCLIGLRLSGEKFYRVPGLFPLSALLLLILLQVVPIPVELLNLSPR